MPSTPAKSAASTEGQGVLMVIQMTGFVWGECSKKVLK
jgi:hypothetical protein